MENNFEIDLYKNLDKDIKDLSKTYDEEYKEQELVINEVEKHVLKAENKYSEVVQKNPRVGMSFGSNFKPRVFFSTNVKTRTKRVLAKNEQYDIRKKDDFDIRVEEIAEILEMNNPYNLYFFLTTEVKKASGSQYLKEFMDK